MMSPFYFEKKGNQIKLLDPISWHLLIPNLEILIDVRHKGCFINTLSFSNLIAFLVDPPFLCKEVNRTQEESDWPTRTRSLNGRETELWE